MTLLRASNLDGVHETLEAGLTGTVLDLTPVLDTNIYADGDVLFDTIALASAFDYGAGVRTLQSVHILDEDDQGVALDLVFLDTLVSLGTFNAAPNISDANARKVLGWLHFATTDYIDLGGSRIAIKTGIALMLKAAAASTSLFVAGITRGGTPTHTAAGLKLKLGFR
jgi:hypothetical protein